MLHLFRFFLISNLTLIFISPATQAQTSKAKQKIIWVCSPCGYDCDGKEYDSAGTCPSCHMPLIKKSSITFKTISPSALHDYVKKHPNVVLLDVRTKEEFEGKANPNFGTLKNAINIPVQELQSKLSTINNLKKKEIIVYCSHAHRSAQASYLLTQNGFKNVKNMSGGVSVMTDSSYKKDFQ